MQFSALNEVKLVLQTTLVYRIDVHARLLILRRNSPLHVYSGLFFPARLFGPALLFGTLE